MDPYYCSFDSPTVAHFVDFEFAPTLLFYSYIPIIIIAIFLSLYIFLKDHYSLQSRLLLAISLFFSIWSFDQIIQWVAVYASVVHFSWEIISLFEVLVFVFSLYFVGVFLNKKDILFKYKIVLGAVLLPVVVALSTTLNMVSFDVTECQSNNGYIWIYIYLFEVISIIVMMYMFFRKFRSLPKGDLFRTQIVILASGIFLFLGMFTATNILGDLILFYEINLIGPIGMVAFIALLTFMIVRFKAFNIKLIGAQSLLVSIIVLIGSQFFFIQNNTNRILTGITLVVTVVIGIYLIRSVKKEITQREKIEKLNEQLEGLIYFISHEVKGYLTKSQAVFSAITDEDYGVVTPELKSISTLALKDNKEGVDTIMTILNSANVKLGTFKFTMAPFDMKASVLNAVLQIRPDVELKNLTLKVDIQDAQDFMIIGDREQIEKHVIRNLIDNSMRYTPKGGLVVTLKKLKDKVLLSVKDTGVGITDEDKARLFTEGGRGAESAKINVSSTGYGLFFAKGIVDAHKGRIWAESAGKGKGSTFYVELPTVEKPQELPIVKKV